MKKIISTIILNVIFSFSLYSQSTSENYIKITVPKQAIETESELNNLADGNKLQTVQYFDGLGREIQTVAYGQSPSGNDMVNFKVYDPMGREVIQYLPYTRNPSLDIDQNTYGNQADFYESAINVAHTTYPFAKTNFEESPLNRVLEQSAPGAPWNMESGHTLNSDFTFNNSGEVPIVKGMDPSHDGWYMENTLIVNETTNEHEKMIRSFIDKQGKTIMKAVQDGNRWNKTYYVYDLKDQLVCVFPPKAYDAVYQFDGGINYAALDNDLLFQYKYDGRGRIIENKVPGAGWTHMVYNNLNQVVLTQTANQREEDGGWTYFKYDRRGNMIISGKDLNDPIKTREIFQSFFDNWEGELWENTASGTTTGYTNNVPPQWGTEFRIINYLDDYDFDNNGIDEYTFTNFSYSPMGGHTAMPVDLTNRTRGLPTGSKVKVINPQGDGVDWISSAIFYDDYGRRIQTQSNNYLGGKEISNTGYDFTGNVLYNQTIHHGMVEEDLNSNISDHEIIVNNWFTYDHANRLIDVYQQNGEEYETDKDRERFRDDKILMVNNVYNELGQLIEKNLHSAVDGSFLQSIDYRYNIRGWLTHINNAGLSDDVMGYEEITWNASNIVTGVELNKIDITATETTDNYGNTVLKVLFEGTKTVELMEPVTLENSSQTFFTISDAKTSSALIFGGSIPLPPPPDPEPEPEPDPDPEPEPQTEYEAYQLIKNNPININLNGYTIEQGYSVDELIGYAQSLLAPEIISRNIENPNAIANLNNDLAAYISISYGNIYTNNDNTDLWGAEIKYNTPTQDINTATQPMFNGNISEIHWKSINNSNKKGYGYTYDDLNRLKSGKYAEKNESSWGKNVGNYNLSSINYDANGNILNLYRNGLTYNNSQFGVMDNLDYSYNGNQLVSITENVGYPIVHSNHFRGYGTYNYTYDANGNMVTDQNKGIVTDIDYNEQNLPTNIPFSNNRSITYIYDAMGTKHHKIANNSGTETNTWYLNGFQYNDDGLAFFATEEGRVVRDVPFGTSGQDGQFRYEYSYKDHLGNLRLTFSDMNFDNSIDASTEVLQEINYYPFGLEHSYATNDLPPLSGTENQYKYNGKEKQTEFGLNWLDYGARMYDPALGRFTIVDPLADDYVSWSPYNYVLGNPISLIDLDGRSPWKSNGDGTWTAEDGDSANSLAKDAGISSEKANELVESQLGENYIGEDGELKSKVKKGDVVDVNSGEVTRNNHIKLHIVNTNKSSDKDEKAMSMNYFSIDSMVKIMEEIDAKTQLLEDAGVFKSAGDDGIGAEINGISRRVQDGIKKNKINKKIDKVNRQIDSLKTEIDKKEKSVRKKSYIEL